MILDSILIPLRYPFEKTMETILLCRMESTPLLEKIKLIAISIIFCPLLPISFSLWITSIIIDTIYCSQRKNPYTLREGNPNLDDKKEPRKVIFWDVSMLWECCVPFGGMRPVSKRIKGVADLILKQKADIVVLKKVSSPAAYALYSRLYSRYKYFYVKIDDVWGDSGRFLASNVPFSDISIEPLSIGRSEEPALSIAFNAGNIKFFHGDNIYNKTPEELKRTSYVQLERQYPVDSSNTSCSRDHDPQDLYDDDDYHQFTLGFQSLDSSNSSDKCKSIATKINANQDGFPLSNYSMTSIEFLD